MYFHNLNTLLSMEGHGPFVWTAYAIGVAVIALLTLAPLRRRRRLLRELAGELRREQQGAADPGGEP